MRVGIVIGEVVTAAAIVFGDEEVQPVVDALDGFSDSCRSDVMLRPDRPFSDGALVGNPAADLAKDRAAAATVPQKFFSAGRGLALSRNRALADADEADTLLCATAILLEKCGRDIDALGATRTGVIMVGPPVDHDVTTEVIGSALSLASFSDASLIARDEAAAWAFWLSTNRRDEKRLLVIDLGEVGVRLSRMRLKLSVVDGGEPVFKLEVEDRGHSQRPAWTDPWTPEELAIALHKLISEILPDRDLPSDVVLIGPSANDPALSGIVKDQVRETQTPEKIFRFLHWEETVLAQAVVKEKPPSSVRSFTLPVANPSDMRALKRMPINAGSYDLPDEREYSDTPERTGPVPASVLKPVFGKPADLNLLGNETEVYAQELAAAWATDVHKLSLLRPTAPTVDLVRAYDARFEQLGFRNAPSEFASPPAEAFRAVAQRYCDTAIEELKGDGTGRTEQTYTALAKHFPDLACKALLNDPADAAVQRNLVIWTNKSGWADPGPLGLSWPGEIVLSRRAAPTVDAFNKIDVPRPGFAASTLPPSMASITAAVPKSGISNSLRWLGGGTKSTTFISGSAVSMAFAFALLVFQLIPSPDYEGQFQIAEPAPQPGECKLNVPEVKTGDSVTTVGVSAKCSARLTFSPSAAPPEVPTLARVEETPDMVCGLVHYRIVRTSTVDVRGTQISLAHNSPVRTDNPIASPRDRLQHCDDMLKRLLGYPVVIPGDPPSNTYPFGAGAAAIQFVAYSRPESTRVVQYSYERDVPEVSGFSYTDVFWAEPIDGSEGIPAVDGWNANLTLSATSFDVGVDGLLEKCLVYGISGNILIAPDYAAQTVALTRGAVERAIFDAIKAPVSVPDALFKMSFVNDADGQVVLTSKSWTIPPDSDPTSVLQKTCNP